MKKSLILLFVLFLVLTLAACGQEVAVSDSTADSTIDAEQEIMAELEELQTADNQPKEESAAETALEDETITIWENVISKEADLRGSLSVSDSHPVPIYGLALDCVKQYNYDEYGNATATDVWYSYDEIGVYMSPYDIFRNGAYGLDITRDSNGQAVAVKGRFNRLKEVCTVESELKDGRVVRHTVRLDPETNAGQNDVVYNYSFAYDEKVNLKSEEVNTYYCFSKLNGKVLTIPYDTPGNDLYEFDTEGHLIRWTHKAHAWSEETYKEYGGYLELIDPSAGKDSAVYTYEYGNGNDSVRVTVTRDGMSTTDEWPIETPDSNIRTNETETIRIPVRKPLEGFATYKIDSTDAFYPELPETLLGVTLPKPDGSRRLTAIRMEGPNFPAEIPVQTVIQYDGTGTPYLQALFFEPGGLHQTNEEYDELDRLIRETYSNATIEYEYAEDGKSYTKTSTYEDGDSSKWVTSLEDALVPDWIRITPEEEYRGQDAVLTYAEDGLILHIKNSWMDRGFSYEADQGEDGSLRILYKLIEKGYDEDYQYTMIEFDAHGYLLYYQEPASGRSLRFTFFYEDMP